MRLHPPLVHGRAAQPGRKGLGLTNRGELLEHSGHRANHCVFGFCLLGKIASAGIEYTWRKRLIECALRVKTALKRALDVFVPCFH